MDVHLADSLAALELEVVRRGQPDRRSRQRRGIPGLALAVALPGGEVSLVESQRRKCEFWNGSARGGGVENARRRAGRAEEWHEGLGAHDVVLARALAAQPVVLEYAAPLLRMGGTLVDWRGRRDPAQEDAAGRRPASWACAASEVRRVAPFEGARDHHLHVYEKVAETPSRFPRRAGIARKRPLGCQ